MVCYIKPGDLATKKTKDRIQQHSNHWILRDNIKDKVLLESFLTGYLKWFVKSEIIIEIKGE